MRQRLSCTSSLMYTLRLLLLLLALFAPLAHATDNGILDTTATSTSTEERARPLRFATTFCSGRDGAAGVHVLSESLLRAGHREGLDVIASADTTEAELTALRAAPLARVTLAPTLRDYCASSVAAIADECGHLLLTLFEGADEGANIVHLAADTVVLAPLTELSQAPAFAAVRDEHSDTFVYDTLVLRRDSAVAVALHDAHCKGGDALRTSVPTTAWTALDDEFGVPADHLDTAWYKRAEARPRVVRFGQVEAKPWAWWTATGARFSLTAAAHWCDKAAYTPYECGWGRDVAVPEKDEDGVLKTVVAVPLRAPGQPAGTSTATKVGVLLSTYSRPTWRALVKHYASMKVVSKVYLVWHNPRADAPPSRELGANVIVLRPQVDSLNNRFSAPSDSALPESVYVCDDDMWVQEKSLAHGFAVWRGDTRRLVGLFPRRWGTGEVKYSARIADGYNIVLTKGVFVHRAFLYMYERLLPGVVKNVVDLHTNCEDILLNFMVSRFTGLAPTHVLVEDSILDLGHHGGISKRGAHFSIRRQCVEDLAAKLGMRGWDPPLSLGSMSVRPLKNREIK